ncbi:two-partner secretion domain-containing protein [Psychrobacter phenylpyruvicus]|uniref:Filamentous hemagglutinin n=2 Tax=Psychrobacter phenylpyruvicus TaxID=29432 RepID=A0A379LIW8_9GAMM|nr:filamentous hemagglutinin N-terminal domain-containing protein [Psychrobacter phenylpyruvicus]SUD89734.1 Filamentous hemagglutinin [Psychrobacter phenylpyruvicus]SUD92354.1 Filamentous hemagglutinin [Psychrobacter phenylpyruvicus]
MNKDCYRVIFSKVRGMMVVVSELTKSQGKKSSADTQLKSFSKPLATPKTSLKRLTVALLCCQSMVYTQALASTTQIQNTASNIPSSQKAALLKAPNGTPIVNIRTPNSKGLSHNTYNQFDIGSNGAILNNSTHGAKTQLADNISGNQYLGKGAANTILNEVRSNKASQLNGTIEVAGQQADIIIANPSGLQIQGGGFINANRATLTTGTPKIDASGNLTSFDIKQGKVQFNNTETGFALGGSVQKQANYVDVLARAIDINGKIQANESVTTVSGSNSVDYDTLAATKITGTDTKPTLAVDISNLGGVYANSIQLIGTEAGLGVKNAGVIQAGQQIRLTNTGKIENSGTIATTKKQTSLIDLEATGSTGSINHTGSLNSYGMINLQTDKDIAINAGAINKHNVSETSQLLPNTINLAAKQNITINNKSNIQNNNTNGGVTVQSKNTTVIDNSNLSSKGDIYIVADKGDNSATSDVSIRNNSQVSATNNVTIYANRDATLQSGTKVTQAESLNLRAGRHAGVDGNGTINTKGDANISAKETASLKNISTQLNVGGGLTVEADQTSIIDSNLSANKGIQVTSQTKNNDILNSHLTSAEGAVVAIANKADLNITGLDASANSSILAANKNTNIKTSNITSNASVIVSGADTLLENTSVAVKDIENAGNVQLQSGGKTDITSSHLEGAKNVSIGSKGYLTLTESEIQAANNLELNNGRIYSNTQLKKKDNGSYYNEYGTKNKQNKLTAGDVLVLNSTSSQYFTNTDLKGSAVLSNAKAGHALSNNLNITATGASKTLAGDINGDVQIVNKDKINLNANHTINAKKDFIVQAAKGITINNSKIKSDAIQLQTTVKNTAKNSEGINNTYGDGDINISNITLTPTGKTDNSLFVDAANHLNLTNTKTTSAGSTTLKSGDLMRVNNSQLNAGKDLIIDSANQIAFNGNRKAGTNASLEYTTSGNTTLTAGEVASINSRNTQAYKNTNVSGGAVLINSGSNIGLNSNVGFNAQSTSALANNNTKLANNPSIAKKTLNGDLSVSSKNDLTIDPKVVTLVSNGDMSLISTATPLSTLLGVEKK